MASSVLPSWHPYKNNRPKAGDKADTIPTITTPLTLAAMGDSITQFARTTSGTNDNFENVGFLSAYLGTSYGRMRLPIGNNLGLAGNSTTQMVARKTDLNALSFDVCTLMGGINDLLSTQPVSNIITNLADLLNHITLTLGKRCIFLNILPNADWNALTAPQIATAKANILAINAWIMAQHATRMGRVVSVDCYTNFSDGSDAPKANATYDDIHPSPYGAYLVAKDMQDRLSPWYGIGISDFVTGNLVTNPSLSGSSGTISGGVINGGGGLGDNWTVTKVGGHYADVNKASGVQMVYHVRAGAGTTGDGQTVYQDITTGFSVGDTVYGVFEIEVSGTPTGVDRLAAELRLTGTGVPTKANSVGMDDDGAVSRIAETYVTVGRWLIVTPDLSISSGSGMTLRLLLNTGLNASLASEALIKIHNAGIFKR